MLEQLLRHINNRFDADASGNPFGSTSGSFKVNGGGIEVAGLVEGQYFWVEGSALNDGLHLYPATDMQPEEFNGRIVFLKIPKAVVELADDIEYWCDEYSDALASPLQSESFGGYSYTKAAGITGGSGGDVSGWQAQFASQMHPFRKVSRDWV